MANSKSEQHTINLANPDLNRERLKGEIRPWDGFNDRNSPYLSGECLPLYTKTISGSNQWISPNLDVYKFNSGWLTKNGVGVGDRMSPITKVTLPDDCLGGTEDCYVLKTGSDRGDIYYHGTKIKSIFYQGYSSDWTDGDIERYFSMDYKESGIQGKPTIAINWCGFCHVFIYDNNTWTEYKSGRTIKTLYEPGYLQSVFNGPTSINSSYNNPSQTYVLFSVGANASNYVLFTDQLTWSDVTGDQTTGTSIRLFIGDTYTVMIDPNEFVMDSFGRFIIRGQFAYNMQTYFFPTTHVFGTYYRVKEIRSNNMSFDLISADTINVADDADDLSAHVRSFSDDLLTYNRCGSTCKICEMSDDTASYDWYNYQTFNSTIPKATTNAIPLYRNTLQGGQCVTQEYDVDTAWRIVFEAGQLSSISSVSAEYGAPRPSDYRGTLLEPWGSVSDCYIFESKIGFKSAIDGKWYSYSKTQGGVNPNYTVYKDRYIIIYTATFENVYDTVEDKWLHFADDWNNRCGNVVYPAPSGYLVQYMASGVEQEFAISKYPFPGYQANPIALRAIREQPMDNNTMVGYDVPPNAGIDCGYIDIYSSDVLYVKYDGTITDQALVYRYSWYRLKESRGYQGLVWTNDDIPLINPPLFTTFQTDLYTMMFTGSSSVLALQQFGQEFLIYYAGTEDSSFTRLCCVQSLFYGLTGDGIYSVDLSNGVLSNSKKIANITGLQYIAYNPLGIVFWNPRNRTMYMFTGDAVLKPIDGMSSFTSITQSKFRPDTEETFMLTNNGLYVSAKDYCYNIKGTYTDVFFTDYGFALKESDKCTCYAYYQAPGHTTLVPLVLETMLYGAGNNVVCTTDCIYLRFYRGDLGDTSATVKISGHTLTDFSTPLQDENGKTYTITKDDWDVDTDTYYLRYQPTYQKGLGMSIRVESDAPLIYMGFGAKLETLQITK